MRWAGCHARQDLTAVLKLLLTAFEFVHTLTITLLLGSVYRYWIYWSILTEPVHLIMLHLYPDADGCFLNASVHHARAVRKWFEENDFRCLPVPPQSRISMQLIMFEMNWMTRIGILYLSLCANCMKCNDCIASFQATESTLWSLCPVVSRLWSGQRWPKHDSWYRS